MDGSGPPPPPASVRCGRGCGLDRLAAFMAWLLGRQARCTARVRWSGRAGAVRGGDVRAAVAGPTARRSERSGWKRRRGVPGRLLRSQRPDRGGILSRVGPGRARHRAGRAGGFCRRHRLLRPLSPAGLALGRDPGDGAREPRLGPRPGWSWRSTPRDAGRPLRPEAADRLRRRRVFDRQFRQRVCPVSGDAGGAPAHRRLFVIAGITALLAVLLEPAGLLFTLFASQVLHMNPVGISELIVVSGVAGGASYVAGGFLTDRFGRRGPGTALTAATAMSAGLSFIGGTPVFVIGNVLWSSFASAATPVFGSWTAELFPT